MSRAISLLLLASLLTAITTGCDQSARLERKAPQDVSLVKSYFDLLRRGHSDQVEGLLDPTLQNAESRANFDELVATVPQEEPKSVKTILVDPRCTEGRCVSGIILEYKYSSERLLFNVVLLKEAGHSSILGINIRILPESFIKANEFTLSNKTFVQYLMLTLAISFPALTVYALVLCIRAQIGRRKWGWALFILFGIGRLGMNWKTRQLDGHFLSMQLLSAWASVRPYQPWVISVSLPLGAILFLINYRRQLFHFSADALRRKTISG